LRSAELADKKIGATMVALSTVNCNEARDGERALLAPDEMDSPERRTAS